MEDRENIPPLDAEMEDPFAATAPEDNGNAGLSISAAAAAKIAQLITEEGKPNLMMRVTVSGGGCSGFQYGFCLDDKTGPDDLVRTEHGVQVVSDTASLPFLNGAELDYVNDLGGSYFRVNNPNAVSSCGCGTSFSL